MESRFGGRHFFAWLDPLVTVGAGKQTAYDVVIKGLWKQYSLCTVWLGSYAAASNFFCIPCAIHPKPLPKPYSSFNFLVHSVSGVP